MNDGLRVRDVRAGYGGHEILAGIDLTVAAGTAVALFGANGSGKSTLLRAIAGMLPRTGEVELNGRDLNGLAAEDVAAAGVVLVPQGRNVFVELTVMENLKVGGSTVARGAIAGEMERVFALLPELAARRKQAAGSLSGGERQMLAIGKALMMRPSALLIDELSFGLAPRVVRRLFDALAQLRKTTGAAILLVEQSPELCAGFADTALLLEGGVIALRSAPEDPEMKARLVRSHLADRNVR